MKDMKFSAEILIKDRSIMCNAGEQDNFVLSKDRKDKYGKLSSRQKRKVFIYFF